MWWNTKFAQMYTHLIIWLCAYIWVLFFVKKFWTCWWSSMYKYMLLLYWPSNFAFCFMYLCVSHAWQHAAEQKRKKLFWLFVALVERKQIFKLFFLQHEYEFLVGNKAQKKNLLDTFEIFCGWAAARAKKKLFDQNFYEWPKKFRAQIIIFFSYHIVCQI